MSLVIGSGVEHDGRADGAWIISAVGRYPAQPTTHMNDNDMPTPDAPINETAQVNPPVTEVDMVDSPFSSDPPAETEAPLEEQPAPVEPQDAPETV